MLLKNIEIQNFRNYENLNLELGEKINIIYGHNGAGKTNILESIYVLAFTKSHRCYLDTKLIQNKKEQATIKGTIIDTIPHNMEIIINNKTKTLKVDQSKLNKTGEYLEKMNIIIFSPEDLNLIRGFPNDRRKYINLQISQISKNYYNVLNDYNKLLKIRNEYLKKISEGNDINYNYLNILNEYLVEKSTFIYQMRIQYTKKLNNICPEIFYNITKTKNFNVEYVPSIEFSSFNKESIKKELKKALSENLVREIKAKTTLYGPHRDDFEFKINNNDLKNYGSQGQQRLAIITIKLSEIQVIKDYKQTSPIVLLDDVFSELDAKKKNDLLSYIKNDMQVIITTTDLDNIDKNIIKQAKLIEIKDGKIINEVR